VDEHNNLLLVMPHLHSDDMLDGEVFPRRKEEVLSPMSKYVSQGYISWTESVYLPGVPGTTSRLMKCGQDYLSWTQ
jgi:hypothetical protein